MTKPVCISLAINKLDCAANLDKDDTQIKCCIFGHTTKTLH